MNILQGKIFGMPRWVFFILLAAGLAGGIYLRRRRTAEVEDTSAEDYTAEEPAASPLEGVDEPGLAGGVGVVSPPGGVYPVTTPYIPEGLTDIIGTLAGGLVETAGYRYEAGAPNAIQQPAQPVATPAAGGGPPARPKPSLRQAPSKQEARKRVQAIAGRHGARSPQAQRARKRLGIPEPPKRKKGRR